LTSCGPAAATRQIAASVCGEITSMMASVLAADHSPPMNSSQRSLVDKDASAFHDELHGLRNSDVVGRQSDQWEPAALG
jgi:hypothetical protein